MCARKVLPVKHSALLHVVAPQWVPARTAWLLTFIDLTAILVGFFVLLYSTQTIDRGSWNEMAGSFKAAFIPRLAVVPVVPQGQNNTDQLRVVQEKDALPYLDSLLRQRLGADGVWKGLVGEERVLMGRKEMAYALPKVVLDGTKPDANAAWGRLADVVRAWKNPLRLRATVAPGEDRLLAAQQAVALAGTLGSKGVREVAAEVVWGKVGAMELVIVNK